jgi:8-oxo-dGTP diphosphatase
LSTAKGGLLPCLTRPWLFAIVREQRPHIYGDALHHVYAVTDWDGGEPLNVSDEHLELRWFSISEMRELTNIVDPDYRRFARQALSSDESQNG